jgi:hypothetical protein
VLVYSQRDVAVRRSAGCYPRQAGQFTLCSTAAPLNLPCARSARAAGACAMG